MRELADPFRRMIEDCCPPAMVRAIEAGGDWRPVWAIVAESGFLDALVAEEAGGAGLSLATVGPLIALVGAHAVPLPVGETMIARALLARSGQPAPAGPIVLATGRAPTLLARMATHVLSGTRAAPQLRASGSGGAIAGELDGDLPDGSKDLRPVAAILRAQLIAGAAARTLEMTVAYANDRQQFGKPIGRQQAVQHPRAVLAEHAVAARIAAAIGARAGIDAGEREAAVAKYGTSVAAGIVAGIAHAVHGAIGMSEEYDLQLLTRRLHGWRLAEGSEAYWATRLGLMRKALAPGDWAAFLHSSTS